MRIDVIGTPIPQGSKTAYVRGGRAVLVEANKKLPLWRKTVQDAAREAFVGELLSSPVSVEITFFMPRPKNPKWADLPASKPDLDKLIRAVFDALTGIVWVDDALAVSVEAHKFWAVDEPGCRVEIWPL